MSRRYAFSERDVVSYKFLLQVNRSRAAVYYKVAAIYKLSGPAPARHALVIVLRAESLEQFDRFGTWLDPLDGTVSAVEFSCGWYNRRR